jgi:hypothetical protein
MSNLGKWESWYSNLSAPESYGDSKSYRIGAEELSNCSEVEDWGCGKGWFAQFLPDHVRYTGLDGSHSKFADKIVDLEKYTSTVEGVFMRHVLEHNYEWETVLSNALDSFTKKFVLCIFTPFSRGKTKQIGYTDSIGIPDLSLSKKKLESMLEQYAYVYKNIESPETFYGKEHIYIISK